MIDPSSSEEESEEDHGHHAKGKGHGTPKQHHSGIGGSLPVHHSQHPHGHPGVPGHGHHGPEKHNANREPHGRHGHGAPETGGSLDVPSNTVSR